MTRRFIVLLMMFVASNLASAQSLKTYSGPYDGGQATYTYIEQEDGSRLYQGKFSWVKTIRERVLTAEGEFLNGKRNGTWTFTSKNTNRSFPANEKLVCQYSNGIHEGEYSYQASANYDGKGSGSYIKTDYTKAPPQMALKANCKSNSFDGHVIMTSADKDKWDALFETSANNIKSAVLKYSSQAGSFTYDTETGTEYFLDSETGEKSVVNTGLWSRFKYSIRARCIDFEGLCEPYPNSSDRYIPLDF